MYKAYKLAHRPLGRAILLHIAAVCAALYLLCTFPGGPYGLLRVAQGGGEEGWSVINVSMRMDAVCLQHVNYGYEWSCDGCSYNRGDYYDCSGDFRAFDYEISQRIFESRVLLKLLWSLSASDAFSHQMRLRGMTVWNVIELVFSMSVFDCSKILQSLSYDEECRREISWGWLDQDVDNVLGLIDDEMNKIRGYNKMSRGERLRRAIRVRKKIRRERVKRMNRIAWMSLVNMARPR
jgi:hypothetical protein